METELVPGGGRAPSPSARFADAAVASRLWDLALAIATVATIALLLHLGRDLTFLGDEWTFLAERMSPSPGVYLRPHNEHLSALLVLYYQVMLRLVGLGSYVPYLAALGVVHAFAVAGLYRLLSAEAGRPTAFALALILLLLGPAFEDLLWGFQIGFVGATAAGVWALGVMQMTPGRGRTVAVAALLGMSMITQGVGLFFLVAAGTLSVVDPRSRRFLPVLVAIGALYSIWFLVFGRAGMQPSSQTFSAHGLSMLPAFIDVGLTTAAAAVTGMGADAGRILALVFIAGMVVRWLRGNAVAPLTIAAMAGLITEFALIGFARSDLGPAQAAVSRYVYPAAALTLIAVGSTLGLPADPASGRRRLILPLAAVAIVIVNAGQFQGGRDYLAAIARETRTVIGYVREYQGFAGVSDDRSLFPMPSVGRLRSLLARYGDPSIPAGGGDYRDAEPAEADRALLRVVGGPAVTAAPAAPRFSPPSLVDQAGVVAGTDGKCLTARPVVDPAWVTVGAPSASLISITAGGSGIVRVALGHAADPSPGTALDVEGAPGQTTWVALPSTPDGSAWKVRVEGRPGLGTLEVCAMPLGAATP